jgi:hypothetical protein
MAPKPLLCAILDDDALTRGLADPEARLLVEWLVERVELLSSQEPSQPILNAQVRQLCRRARAVSRFVHLWCHQNARGAAGQLAAAERFPWPLPTEAVDPYELMRDILAWEGDRPDED